MIDEKLKQRFDALLMEGEATLRQSGWPGRDSYRHPDQVGYVRFRTEAANLVRRACGEKSDHYCDLRKIADDSTTAFNSYYYRECFAILQAAQKDYEGGLLFDVRRLVAAELFADFLDQAKHLLDNGFHVPAASLAGAVLEDGLRKLCTKNSIPFADRTKIDSLNVELARADVYSKLTQKNITAYADIRNNADHGHFDKFKPADVSEMLTWVGRFLAEHLE
jgi:hypothetical protein